MNKKHEDRFHYLVHNLNAQEITREELNELKVLIESVPLKEPEPIEGWINVWGPRHTHVQTLYPTYEAARHAACEVSGEGPTPYAKTVKMREVKE